MIIEASDHFSTDNPEELEDNYQCIPRFIGEFIKENETYIYLRHIKADINNSNSAQEIHSVLKSTIIRKKEIEIKWDE